MAISIEALRGLLTEMDYSTAGLSDSTPLGPEGVGLDSLGVMELTQRIEDEWDAAVPPEIYSEMHNLSAGQLLQSLNESR